MQVVFSGDNLHNMSKPVLWGKKEKNVINLSSAELAQIVVKVQLDPELDHVHVLSLQSELCWTFNNKLPLPRKYFL